MIEWGSFLIVLIASIVAACGVVALFSLGLRFAGPETPRKTRGLGILCFIVCGLVIAYGVYLIIPFFHP
jgi:predicted permease